MGLGIGLGGKSISIYDKCCDCSQNSKQIIIPRGNPNPSNFFIRRSVTIGNFLLLLVHYPDCNNYEGNKILVYRNTTLDEIIYSNNNTLDPHFSNNTNFKTPIMRFEPSELGWTMAGEVCKYMAREKLWQ